MGTGLGDIPSAIGTYVVLLQLMQFKTITIGQLGRIDFLPGWYAYVGSAMGPGGLSARVGRHHRLRKKKHWHIDYLRPATRMEGLFVVTDPRRREHRWAQLIGEIPLSGQPVSGFGATDCQCGAHLFYYAQRPDPHFMASVLEARWIPLAKGARNQ